MLCILNENTDICRLLAIHSRIWKVAWDKDILLLAISEGSNKTKEHGPLTGMFSGGLAL